MAEKPDPKAGEKPESSERDEPIKIDLDPEVALKGFVEVGTQPKPAVRVPKAAHD
jgi:hypothetical protein